jgi:hypothetical protein
MVCGETGTGRITIRDTRFFIVLLPRSKNLRMFGLEFCFAYVWSSQIPTSITLGSFQSTLFFSVAKIFQLANYSKILADLKADWLSR